MKNLFLSITLLFSTIAFAQVDEEAIYLTGGLNFSSGSGGFDFGGVDSDVDATSFGISAGGGYMITDIFGVGLNLGYASTKLTQVVDSFPTEATVSTFSIGPSARAYIEIDEPLYFTTNLIVNIGFGKNKTELPGIGSFEQSFSTFTAGISPGLTYFFSDNIALDINAGFIGYNSISQEVENPIDPDNTIKVSSGSFDFIVDATTINFGLTFMFNN